jgi:hypothetical protein
VTSLQPGPPFDKQGAGRCASPLPAGLPLDIHPVLMLSPHGLTQGAHLLPGELMAPASAKPLTALLQHARGTAPLTVPVLGET